MIISNAVLKWKTCSEYCNSRFKAMAWNQYYWQAQNATKF